MIMVRREELGKTITLGTMTIEEVIDGVGMAILLVVTQFIVETPPWMRQAMVVFVAVIVVLLVILVVLLRTDGSRWIKGINLPERWTTLLINGLAKLREGLKSLKSGTVLVNSVAISFANWMVQALMVTLSLRAVGIDALGFNHAIFILMTINLALLIPAAPGSLGTFEIGGILGLGFLGFGNTEAMSFVLVYHFAQLLPVTLVGILVLPLMGMGFRDLGQSSRSL
jgi:hypothetical protein